MKNIINIIHIILSIILIILVLIQSKGTGFGKSNKSNVSFTRRGLEKLIFKITFVVSGLFILISILQLFL